MDFKKNLNLINLTALLKHKHQRQVVEDGFERIE